MEDTKSGSTATGRIKWREPAVPGQLDAINASCKPRDGYSPAACPGREDNHRWPWLYLGSDLVKETMVRGLGRPQVSCTRLSPSTVPLSRWHRTGCIIIRRMDVCVSGGVRQLWWLQASKGDGRRKLCVRDLLQSQAFLVRVRPQCDGMCVRWVTIVLSMGIHVFFPTQLEAFQHESWRVP